MMWEVVVGAIIAICIAIGIENLRRPRLRLGIETPPIEPSYPPDRPASSSRALRVNLFNKPLRWMVREAALECEATVHFRYLDGRDVFEKPMFDKPMMEGRWAESPEPLESPIINLMGAQIGRLVDFNLISKPSRVDVHPGDTKHLDIAARFDSDVECYAWNNEAYFSNPRWRNPARKLGPGRYLVDVTVKSSGQARCDHYVLMNDGPRSTFRLEPAASPFSIPAPPGRNNVGGGIVIRPRCYPPTPDGTPPVTAAPPAP